MFVFLCSMNINEIRIEICQIIWILSIQGKKRNILFVLGEGVALFFLIYYLLVLMI